MLNVKRIYYPVLQRGSITQIITKLKFNYNVFQPSNFLSSYAAYFFHYTWVKLGQILHTHTRFTASTQLCITVHLYYLKPHCLPTL